MITFEEYSKVEENILLITKYVISEMKEDLNEDVQSNCGILIKDKGSVTDAVELLMAMNLAPNEYVGHKALQGKNVAGCIEALKRSIATRLGITVGGNDGNKVKEEFISKLNAVINGLQSEAESKLGVIQKASAKMILNKIRDAIKKLA